MCIATTYNLFNRSVCDDSFLLYILNTLLSHYLGNLFFRCLEVESNTYNTILTNKQLVYFLQY